MNKNTTKRTELIIPEDLSNRLRQFAESIAATSASFEDVYNAGMKLRKLLLDQFAEEKIKHINL